MANQKVSVQVLNWNGKKFLKGCFDSLLKQDYHPLELIFIDNHSSDSSVEFIERAYKKEIKIRKLKLIKFEKNLGFCEGNSKPYRESSSKYVLILNNDIKIPSRDFISCLVECAKKHNATLVGGVERKFDAKEEKEEKYHTLNVVGFNANNVIEGDDVFYVNGSCILVDKEKNGNELFPNEYFAYGEDVYLGWKTRLTGKTAVYTKKAVYIHYGSATSGKRSLFLRRYAEKNRIANLLIFFSPKTLIKIFPLFLFENFIKIVYSLKYPKLLKALFSAFFWDIRHLGFILENRKKIQAERKISDEELIKLMSYKVFPEHITPSISNFLNKIAKFYCRMFAIKTYDLN